MSKTRYFHEDDYCQIEILPAENLSFCKQQAGEINEFAEDHREGIGFTDMYVRNENPLSLFEKKLKASQLEHTLAPIMEKCDEVLTGYSSYHEKCKATCAFDLNDKIAIFYDFDEGIVKNIWLDLCPTTHAEVDTAIRIFNALSTLGDFIIADWGWSFVREISDENSIHEYLNKRLEVFSK